MKHVFLALISGLSLSGCLSLPAPMKFAAAPSAKARSGQVRYQQGEQSLIGEALISYVSATDYYLGFGAGPGFPLLELRRDGEQVTAQGALARGRWRGEAKRAPAQIAAWLALAPAWIARPTGAGRWEMTAPDGARFGMVER